MRPARPSLRGELGPLRKPAHTKLSGRRKCQHSSSTLNPNSEYMIQLVLLYYSLPCACNAVHHAKQFDGPAGELGPATITFTPQRPCPCSDAPPQDELTAYANFRYVVHCTGSASLQTGFKCTAGHHNNYQPTRILLTATSWSMHRPKPPRPPHRSQLTTGPTAPTPEPPLQRAPSLRTAAASCCTCTPPAQSRTP